MSVLAGMRDVYVCTYVDGLFKHIDMCLSFAISFLNMPFKRLLRLISYKKLVKKLAINILLTIIMNKALRKAIIILVSNYVNK